MWEEILPDILLVLLWRMLVCLKKGGNHNIHDSSTGHDGDELILL